MEKRLILSSDLICFETGSRVLISGDIKQGKAVTDNDGISVSGSSEEACSLSFAIDLQIAHR